MKCSIIGLGTAEASEEVAQEDALQLSSDVICENERQERILRTLFRKAGVNTRRTVIPWKIGYAWNDATQAGADSANGTAGPTTGERMQLYQQYATPLAMASATEAIHDAGILAGDITHLVTVSCTGFAAPGVDVDLIRNLGLRNTTQRVHVGYMGCHGAVNAMRTVQGLTAADPEACVLMCCVELCSLHFRMQWDDEGIVGNALFADGSSSLIAVGNRWSDSHGHANQVCEIAATGACLIDDTLDEMSWNIGDHGFEMRLTSGVPECIATHLHPWLDKWLQSNNLNVEDVARWIVHPGGPKILDAVEQSLQLKPEALQISREVLGDLGNMSSATVLFVLQRGRTQPVEGPAVVLAFGPGVMAEAALLR